MRRSYKFRLKPTKGQEILLTAMLKDHCDLYNAALEDRKYMWRRYRRGVSFFEQSKQLKDIRVADENYSRWAFTSEEDVLRRLDRAMQAFFRRVKAGQTPGFPRFRSATRYDSVTWKTPEHGYRWNASPGRVRFMGVGHVKVIQHREVLGIIKTASVKREGRKWYVVLSCDGVPANPLPPTGNSIGLDMATGENGFAYTSDRGRIDNPRYLHQTAGKLADAQRDLSRKRKGSKRRRKAVARVGNLYRKVSRQRLDTAHKAALTLVRGNDLIAVEALQITNMTRRAAPKPDPDHPGAFLPNGGTAKSGLNKSILDAGWGVFLNILHAKAESAGRTVVEVNPANTSRTCAACGHVDADNRHGKAFKCLRCGHEDDADMNAATNILRAGLALRGP